MEQILDVDNLTVQISAGGHAFPALEGVSFQLNRGEIVGLVGESGCGKSLTSLSIIGLLPDAAQITAGHMHFHQFDLAVLPEQKWCSIRGKDISMVFQEPMTALNPLVPVGAQIAEAFAQHRSENKGAARKAALKMMKQVGLSRVESLYWEYPHQLSGGMKQRIVIAMALINHPELLIADEPTTALDVTIQYQILQLMQELNRTLSTTILLVSHDLGVVREICSKVLVMYAGFIVEEGNADQVLHQPLHPYTRQLVASIPTAEKRGQPLYTIPGVVAPLNKRKSGQCPFCSRCANVQAACRKIVPPLEKLADGRKVRCLFAKGDAQ